MKIQFTNIILLVGLVILFSIVILDLTIINASSAPISSLTANVAVGNIIYISLSPSTINLGDITPSATTGVSFYTNTLITDTDNGGNLGANVILSGTSFTYSGNIIGVSNTLWSATAQSSYTGIPLTTTTNTISIKVSQPTVLSTSTSNNVYFGFNIPAGTPPGNYVQTITFNNLNTTHLTSSPNSIVTIYANVVSVCYISLSASALNFNSIYPTENVITNKQLTNTNFGNVAANILISGTNWILNSNSAISFGVSNTLWNPTSQSSYTGNSLTNSLVSTSILVPASGTNSIYFGLGVPAGVSGGSYSQTITIENTC